MNLSRIPNLVGRLYYRDENGLNQNCMGAKLGFKYGYDPVAPVRFFESQFSLSLKWG